jgi:hypothetical protein
VQDAEFLFRSDFLCKARLNQKYPFRATFGATPFEPELQPLNLNYEQLLGLAKSSGHRKGPKLLYPDPARSGEGHGSAVHDQRKRVVGKDCVSGEG